MTSTATTRLRLEKQGTGDNSNTWGATLNSAVFDLIDEAIAGVTSYTLSGSKTLTSTNYAADEARDVANGGVWRPMALDIVLVPGQNDTFVNIDPMLIVPKNHDWRIRAKTNANTAEIFAEAGGPLASIST